MKLYTLRIQYISDHEFCGAFTTPEKAEAAIPVEERKYTTFQVVEIDTDVFIGEFNSLPSMDDV